MNISATLWELAFPFQRVFIFVSVVGLAAMAVACLATVAERDYIAVAALMVFGLSIIAWVAASSWMLWRWVATAVRWWANRRDGTPTFTGSETG